MVCQFRLLASSFLRRTNRRSLSPSLALRQSLDSSSLQPLVSLCGWSDSHFFSPNAHAAPRPCFPFSSSTLSQERDGFDFGKLEKKVSGVSARYQHLLDKVNSEATPQAEMAKIHKELGKLHSTVENIEQLKKLREDEEGMTQMIEDENEDKDLRELAGEERKVIRKQVEDIQFDIMKDILPKPTENVKGLLLEIRAGAGGEEAALFVVDLFQMYQKFASRNRWKFETLSLDESEYGGYKEVIVELSGDNAYNQMQFESGIHRVQRVPKTEAGGRIHTSASSVAVMPQASEVEFTLNESDLKIETYRSGGAGGQSVNTTDSAVRITHVPSQVSVAIQDERSQHKNKAKAMKILSARLYEEELRKRNAALAEKRKSQIGSGDRSERIRTYNFQQGRVTDHRINLTVHNLEQVLAGMELDTIIDALERQSLLDYLEAAGAEP